MALVVFLRGVNVGGHKRFRPSVLAGRLSQFDVVNIGAAGTFVVRRPVSRTTLRAELEPALPFETEVMICDGRDLRRLVESNPFLRHRSDRMLVPYVSVLARMRRPSSTLPLAFPGTGDWEMKVLGQQGRFVFGVYRRMMRAIGHLGQIDRLYGVSATTRNWNTIMAIAAVLGEVRAQRGGMSPDSL